MATAPPFELPTPRAPVAAQSTYRSAILSSYGIEPDHQHLRGCVCATCPLSQWQTDSGRLLSLCAQTGLQSFGAEALVQACDIRERFLLDGEA